MSVLATALVPLAESESYTDLLRSGPHWLIELTLGYSVSVTRVTYARCPRAAARTPVRGGPPARGRRV